MLAALSEPEFAELYADDRFAVSREQLERILVDSEVEAWRTVPTQRRDDLEARRAAARVEEAIGTRTSVATMAGIVGALAAGVGVGATAGTSAGIGAAVGVVVGVLILGVVATRALRPRQQAAAQEATAARARLLDALTDSGIRERAREVFKLDTWDLSMRVGEAPGLAQLASARFEVSTDSQDALISVMRQISDGGAIGVSGPRGAGKTTLIESVCEGRTKVVDGHPLGLFLSAPVHYEPRDFIVHLLLSVCEKVIGGDQADALRRRAFDDLASVQRRRTATALGALALLFAGAAVLNALGVTLSSASERTLVFGGVAGAMVALAALLLLRRPLGWPLRGRARATEPLVRTAMQLQQEAKFQQSYTSGWSGTLKLPLGVGVGADSKLSLAQTQMTLPELVDRLKGFLEQVATQRGAPVIIGIDELDKIGTSEQARAFLNGIKGIFGVPGVYFLVSVSQDAMSSFERRGLPFRDVFDSSFDEIVDAQYLDLEGTRRLLRRRVVGMPTPFHALCHCLAAGLPRDVVRAARDVVAPPPGKPSTAERTLQLQAVTRALVAAEIQRKCRATAVAARNAREQTGRDALFEFIDDLSALEVEPAEYVKSYRAFTSSVETRIPRPADGDSRVTLRALGDELNVFSLYCATLLELFEDGADALEPFADKGPDGEASLIDRIAKARQEFAVDQGTAARAIEALRREAKLAG